MTFFENIKPHLLPIIICVTVGVAGGVAIGWFAKPDVVRIEEHETVVEKEVTTEAQKALMTAFENLRIEMEKVRETQVVEKYHREVIETKLADGSYTKTTTIDKNVESHTKETETRVEVKVVEVEKKIETIKTEYVDRVVEKDRIVTPVLAQWHVGVMAGVAPHFDNVPSSPIMLGVDVERRIVGPVFVGVWGMAGSPVTGLNIVNGAAGIKVGVEF